MGPAWLLLLLLLQRGLARPPCPRLQHQQLLPLGACAPHRWPPASGQAPTGWPLASPVRMRVGVQRHRWVAAAAWHVWLPGAKAS
jgi:hypothetical protein